MVRASRLLALACWLGVVAAPGWAQGIDDPPEAGEEAAQDSPGDPASADQMDGQSWAGTTALYAEPPDLARCRPGVLRPDVTASFVAALNALRARHGLAPVRYNHDLEAQAAQAALMMAANNDLSHDPPPSWKCWTAAGARAAGSSNLLGGVSSPYLAYEDDNAMLAEWMIEGDSDEIGHRRWILDPNLAQTSLGRVIAVLPNGTRVDSAVMTVFNFPGQSEERRASARPVPAFVAWPQGRYPKSFFSPRARFSFSVTQDKSETDTVAEVDFSQSNVTISDGTRTVPIRDQASDNEGYGLPNCLSWRADGIEIGVTYTVTITGIRGVRSSRYTYTFSIVKN